MTIMQRTSAAAQGCTGQGFFTGQEYLESLRDGREVWINGERVEDVTTHPAFRNSARMIARLYDSLHDPAKRDLLTVERPDGGRAHRFFQAPRNWEEQVAARDAVAEWARMTYGWMGRSPDYKGSWIASLAVDEGLYDKYYPNAKRWHDFVCDRLPFLNHAIVHPPVDRHLSNNNDVFVHVEEETDAGLIVSGAKVVATGAALTHHTFVAHFQTVNERKYSPVFMVPTNAPGLKLICRTSFELASATVGSPFDNPLSSRFDENDSILVLDRVFIPWEDVLMYGEDQANKFVMGTGFLTRALLHGCTRLSVKLGFIAGLFMKAVEITGTKDFRGVQAAVGEVIGARNTIAALADTMARNAVPWYGYVLPDVEAALSYRAIAGDTYSRVRNLVYKTVGSALIYLPSSTQDLLNPTVRPYLDQYVRGSNGIDSEQRVKTLKLLWDAVGSEFASRHELYEINYAGSYEASQIEPLNAAKGMGRVAEYLGMVDACMAEYDVNGWTAPDLIAAGDVSVRKKTAHG